VLGDDLGEALEADHADLLGGPEVLPPAAQRVLALGDQLVEVLGEGRKIAASVVDHCVVVVRHRARQQDVDATLLRGDGEAVQEIVVRRVIRTQQELPLGTKGRSIRACRGCRRTRTWTLACGSSPLSGPTVTTPAVRSSTSDPRGEHDYRLHVRPRSVSPWLARDQPRSGSPQGVPISPARRSCSHNRAVHHARGGRSSCRHSRGATGASVHPPLGGDDLRCRRAA